MPLYSYACPLCGAERDEYRDVSDRNLELACDECGGDMARMWTAPNFSGDLPCTGWRQNVAGYDEGLDEYVTDASHRKRIMERKGLVEAAPDPKFKKVRDEMKYVKNHAGPGEQKEAAVACRKMGADAAKARRTGIVKKKVREGLKDL
jgi:putative FmdB family regulatory protein